jgi:hypothetical protein
MPTVNGPDEITDLEAGNDKVFYSDSSGDVTEVALGAAATVLTSSGATSAPTFSAIPADPTVGANKTMYTNNSDVESGLAFGAAGTVLTSGGTDATATPPTWAVPTGGQEVAMTADGAVAAGKIVAWKAGKAVQISTTTAPQSNGGANTGVSSEANYGTNAFDATFDPDRNTGFYAMQRLQSGVYYQLHQNVIQYSGTAASSPAVSGWGSTLYDIDGNQSYGTQYAAVSCAYDTANDQPMVIYRNLSSQLEFRSFYYNAAWPYYGLSSSAVVYSGSIGECTAMCFNPTTNQVIFAFTIGSDVYLQVGDRSTGVLVMGPYTPSVDAGNSSGDKFAMVWDPVEEVAIIVYSNGTSGTKARAFSISGAGASSTLVGGTAVSLGSGEFPDKRPAIGYDHEAARTYFLASNSSNYFLSSHIQASGTTLTGSAVKSFSGDSSMGSAGQYLGPARAASGTGINGVVVCYSNYGGGQYEYMGTVEYRAATDDVFWKEAPHLFASTVTYGPMVTYDSVKGFACTYWINGTGATSTTMCYYIPNKSSSTGTNVLGIAQSTVTDGQSVTISMAGKTYTTSGLTAGELYYAAGNGDPSTTAARTGTLAGPFAIAKSTTELLIMRQLFGDEA